MTLDELPALLTVDEARRVLRVGRNQLYAAVKRGEVPSIRIGSSIRVPRHALEALIAATGSAALVGAAPVESSSGATERGAHG